MLLKDQKPFGIKDCYPLKAKNVERSIRTFAQKHLGFQHLQDISIGKGITLVFAITSWEKSDTTLGSGEEVIITPRSLL
jgi:hypothetical protein